MSLEASEGKTLVYNKGIEHLVQGQSGKGSLS